MKRTNQVSLLTIKY